MRSGGLGGWVSGLDARLTRRESVPRPLTVFPTDTLSSIDSTDGGGRAAKSTWMGSSVTAILWESRRTLAIVLSRALHDGSLGEKQRRGAVTICPCGERIRSRQLQSPIQ